jgi:parallel beta-helix repeat protein
MSRRSYLAGPVVLAAVLFAGQADAATIKVKPGKNALQKAVDKADPGDRLLVKRGTYREDVLVDKRLRIIGKGRKPPVINGRCRTDRTIDVVADGVTLRHLKVKGARSGAGNGYTVNLVGIESGTFSDLLVKETCDANPAYYGVNVAQSGALTITEVTAEGGFIDAGIYVGSIGDVGPKPFRISDNLTRGNNVGILIEDSVPEANIVVRDNRTIGNDVPGLSAPAGILVRRSDGGRYIDNVANRNGDYGIHLLDDGGNTSDDNVLNGNAAINSGVADFFDEGTGNCGSGNSFPIDPC